MCVCSDTPGCGSSWPEWFSARLSLPLAKYANGLTPVFVQSREGKATRRKPSRQDQSLNVRSHPLLFSSLSSCSDGAHDGDDVGGWTGGVRPQRPADLRRVRRQGHRLPLQRHDVRRLQRILQVGFFFFSFSQACHVSVQSVSYAACEVPWQTFHACVPPRPPRRVYSGRWRDPTFKTKVYI